MNNFLRARPATCRSPLRIKYRLSSVTKRRPRLEAIIPGLRPSQCWFLYRSKVTPRNPSLISNLEELTQTGKDRAPSRHRNGGSIPAVGTHGTLRDSRLRNKLEYFVLASFPVTLIDIS